MATKRRSRKRNTALVLNPAGRSLSIGGSRRATNPARRRRKASGRRRNPVAVKAVSRRRNPIRKANPINSVSGLITAAVFAGIGVSIFDVVSSKVLPNQAGLVRTGVKAGSAWAISVWGGKLPVLGKFRNEIALVLLTSAAIDVMKIYLFPLIAGAAGSVGLLIPAGAVQQAGDGTTGNIYGNSYIPYS